MVILPTLALLNVLKHAVSSWKLTKAVQVLCWVFRQFILSLRFFDHAELGLSGFK